MITYLLSVIFFGLAAIAYVKHRRVISPMFITPLIWAIILFLFQAAPHEYYQLKGPFLIAISIWVSTFFIFGLYADSLNVERLASGKTIFNESIYYVMFGLVVVSFPIIAYKLYTDANSSGPEYLITRLRQLNTGQIDAENSIGILSYVFIMAYICLLLELSIAKVSHIRRTVIIFINVVLCLLTLAKTMFFILIISIFVIQYNKGKIKFKHFAYLSAGVFTIIVGLTLLRGDAEDGVFMVFWDTLKLYCFSPIVAFEQIENMEQIFGGNTFRFFYAVAKSLTHSADIQVLPTILEFVEVPIETNIYTIMYPFYADFGYIGVFFFAAIYGFTIQMAFRLAMKGSMFYSVILGYFLASIILQFMGDFIITNFSNTLQLIIVSYIIVCFKPNLLKW